MNPGVPAPPTTTSGVPLVAVTADPLDLSALSRELERSASADGAITSFVGLVRDHNQGRRVSYLEYEAYEPLAVRALNLIIDESRALWPTARLGVHHRTGRLEIGEASIIIVAASPHRADAFAACRYMIERVKQIVPIWKHEHFEGGDVWLEGAIADPDDEAARDTARRIACA
jgi:molybdopterin synthase catalytic subunit